MNAIRKYILLGVSVCWAIGSAWAVPATPRPVVRTMADGTEQEVLLWGDENGSYLTTLAGERIAGSFVGDGSATVLQKARQEIWLEENGGTNAGLENTDEGGVQRAPQNTMRSYYVPRTGTVRIPVVLVNFTDLQFTLENAREQFDALYNANGGSNPNATGSVSGYYAASSDSALNLIFDVYGPYDLAHDMAYYGGNTQSSHAQRGTQLVQEAASLATNAGVDFSQYDANGDGYIDNLSIVVAGYNEAEGGPADAIWPYYSELSSSTTYSGKRIRGYLMISEYRSSGGKIQAGIGTYCHEFGHALGLPDLYDTEQSIRYTVGDWDVMCSGCYNNNGSTPPTYTAFERFVMGWLVPEQLTRRSNYVLDPIESANKAYLIADTIHNLETMTPNPTEYFLIENRQQVGWDAGRNALVSTGLLVSHITFSSSTWNWNTFNNGTILGYAIVSANNQSPTYSTAADVFPGSGHITLWQPTMNDGSVLTEQTVSNITQLADGAVSFRYGMQSDTGLFFTPQTIDALETTYDGQPVHYDTACVALNIKDLATDSVSLYLSSGNFEFSIDGGKTWISSGEGRMDLEVLQDSVYDIYVYVRYAPTRQSCTTQTAYLIAESSDGQYVNQLQLQGAAPRPTYITTPVIVGSEDVSSSAFTLVWDPQEDAEFYYVTLYSLSPDASTWVQGFENFNTAEGIAQEGWSANFASTTQVVSEQDKALYFTESGQWVESEEYHLVPEKIRLWISNTLSAGISGTAYGTLVVEALNPHTEAWDTVGQQRVAQTTKNFSKEFELPADSGYVRFRLSCAVLQGTGGIAVDNFTVYLDRTVNYVYSGTEKELYGTTDRAILSDLSAGTVYQARVQAYEDKGCEEHYSPLSAAVEVTTLQKNTGRVRLTVVRGEDGSYTTALPEPADGKSTLYIYNTVGQLIASEAIAYGTTVLTIPTDGMQANNIYLIKIIENKMTRKAASGRMLYY